MFSRTIDVQTIHARYAKSYHIYIYCNLVSEYITVCLTRGDLDWEYAQLNGAPTSQKWRKGIGVADETKSHAIWSIVTPYVKSASIERS